MSLPVPAQRFRLLLPPTQPAVPHVTLRMGSNRRKARPRGEDLSTQIQSPPCSSVGRGGEQIKRGREGSPGIQTTAAKRQARGTAAGERCRSNSAGSGARPGCQACKCRTERKNKTKQKKKPKQPKKKRTNRNKPNPRGMQCDNPKLEGPPGRRVEELGLQCGQQLSGHSSLHVTLQF